MSALFTNSEATTNLVETYFRLASATVGSSLWQHGNLRGCSGSFIHPICNFAVAAELTNADRHELEQLFRQQEQFHFYLLPSAEQEALAKSLLELGLRTSYRLHLLTAPPTYGLSAVNPIEATTYGARLALARFMVSQFFMSQPRPAREEIARSTARAGGLDLYAIGYQSQIIGGMMLCREGSTLGIYNLCVAPDFRRQGWGKAIIDWCRAKAGAEGRTVTLQCDPRLVTWYLRSGFTEFGQIAAFSRP